MASYVNGVGVETPALGRQVNYVPEVGTTWTATVTEVVGDLNVRLTAFPPGEPPRGIERVISYANANEPLNDTWHWNGEITEIVQDPFDNEPHPDDIADLEK